MQQGYTAEPLEVQTSVGETGFVVVVQTSRLMGARPGDRVVAHGDEGWRVVNPERREGKGQSKAGVVIIVLVGLLSLLLCLGTGSLVFGVGV